MPDQVKGIVYASVAAILWGVLAIALKVSLDGLSSADISWFRFASAFIILSSYYYISKPKYLRILRKPPGLLILASGCLAINYYGFVEGVNLTSPSIAQIFIQLGPVLLALSGFVIFREKVTWKQLAGFIMVMAGLLVFYNEQWHAVFHGGGSWQNGVIWVLIAAVAWTAYSVLVKILVLKHPPMQLNLLIFGLPAILFLPLINIHHFLNISFVSWLVLIFLGLNTLFAYGMLSLALKFVEANKVSVIIVFNPILTFVLMAIIGAMDAKWIDHEHYTMVTIIGAAVVITGGLLAIMRKQDKYGQ